MKALWKHAALPALAAIGLLTLSCSSPFETNYSGLLELKDNRELWEKRGPAHYEFTLVRHCFCPETYSGPLEVEVAGNEVISVRHLELDSLQEPSTGTTVESLFDDIQSFHESGADVSVDYDSRLGYPTRVSFHADFPDGSFSTLLSNLAVISADK